MILTFCNTKELFRPHCFIFYSVKDSSHHYGFLPIFLPDFDRSDSFFCQRSSLIILTIHPPTYQVPFCLIDTFPFFAMLSSSHPPTSVSPIIFISSSLFSLSLCLPGGLVSLALVLGGDSSLESLIKHLQALAPIHTVTHAHLYSTTPHRHTHRQAQIHLSHNLTISYYVNAENTHRQIQI